MITFTNVSKQFGRKNVLKDINFSIPPGKFVTIVGPSGAGKSTLLHILIGAISPTTGTVEVDNLVINELDTETLQMYRRKIGVIFQDYKLLPKKTIGENIAFAMEVCNASNLEIQKRVIQVLDIVGLIPVINNFPHELSGGEQQRAAIARALIHNPNLILADEPTGNLDPDNTRDIIELLKKINECGVTVVLATHNQEIINTLQRRVIKIQRGRIVNS